MITQLKSKKAVSIDLADPARKEIIYCQIEVYNQDSDGFLINGKYIYKEANPIVEGEEPTFTDKIVRQWDEPISNEDYNALFTALHITYPSGLTPIEKREYELKKGMIYKLTAKPRFGLLGTDWE